MSKYILERKLKNELQLVNDIIDQKIIRGLSYKSEAKRHKFIMQRLADVRYGQSKWFPRQLSGFSII